MPLPAGLSGRRLLAGLLVPLAYGAARLLGPRGPEGAFLAGLTALLTGAALAAALPWRLAERAGTVGLGALGVGVVALSCGASAAQALAAVVLLASTGLAAAGLAALGRALGAGPVGAGVAALLVVAAGLDGLFWADALAERLPAERRWALRQAVLAVDPATAYAYGAAGFDRLLHGPVYTSVPLASSSFERPEALPTALAWAALGLLAQAAASAAGRWRRTSPA